MKKTEKLGVRFTNVLSRYRCAHYDYRHEKLQVKTDNILCTWLHSRTFFLSCVLRRKVVSSTVMPVSQPKRTSAISWLRIPDRIKKYEMLLRDTDHNFLTTKNLSDLSTFSIQKQVNEMRYLISVLIFMGIRQSLVTVVARRPKRLNRAASN